MISIDNQPTNCRPNNADFTVASYRKLITLALLSYEVADYSSINWKKRFVLWRHDCDISLNRSLALAKIEADLGLKSTFFLNPHCEFYNLLEHSQQALIHEILGLGHDIGLHFDAAFYGTASEDDLNRQVESEASFLESFLGERPVAFSFHNPTSFNLTCEANTYGGLLNCYSKRFKTEVPYCSDSNGYWRFQRLFDVLEEANSPCLQVLTHPGWWHEKPSSPRSRIFKSIYGRATATMRAYDQSLKEDGRENIAGQTQAIKFLEPIKPKIFKLLDYLWNSEEYETLFSELWRLHKSQINKLCAAVFEKEWKVPHEEVTDYFNKSDLNISPQTLFRAVFDVPWYQVIGMGDVSYRDWQGIETKLSLGYPVIPKTTLEEGCVLVCKIVESTAAWGGSQANEYDGLAELSSIDIIENITAEAILIDCPEYITAKNTGILNERWEAFKVSMMI
jgi:peptidoglycan/xylan/chitin deacetylase (PgdA/CDA1 family)